jgi:predicted DNA binding CopG/RHH family protein
MDTNDINNVKDPTIQNAKKAELVIKEFQERHPKDKQVNIRLTPEQYNEIEQRMKIYKFTSISEYLRFVGTNANIDINVDGR